MGTESKGSACNYPHSKVDQCNVLIPTASNADQPEVEGRERADAVTGVDHQLWKDMRRERREGGR